MNAKFTKKAQKALDLTLLCARELGHTYVGSEHLLLGLLSVEDCVAGRILTDCGIEYTKIRDLVCENIGKGTVSDVSAADMTPMTRKIIEESAQAAKRLNHSQIGTEHLLLAIITERDAFANRMIKAAKGSQAQIKGEISKVLGTQEKIDGGGEFKKNSAEIPSCPTLSRFGQDMCRAALEGRIDPIFGREEESARIIRILARRTKNNPCLIGEPGVGKTAVIEGLCRRIVAGDVPDRLKDKIIVSLDISAMVAGAKYRGEFEERMKNVMAEISKNRNIILFVDEIHTIIGAGGAEGAVDAANIIKPALARGSMQLIGATTVDEYRRHIEKDAALERRFQSVNVGEPGEEETLRILFGLRDKYEEHHSLKISDDALRAAVSLSIRYIPERFLPDKAIDLIDEAASKKSIERKTGISEASFVEKRALMQKKEMAVLSRDFEKALAIREEERAIEKSIAVMDEDEGEQELCVERCDVEDIVSAWTGIPVKPLAWEEGERLLNLDELLNNEVIGQRRAAIAVARSIRRAKAGLKDPKRPIGSFVFLGPTGVGKTHLAKILAKIMFSGENSLIRIDMSEYMEKHSVSKLIGSPPGYVGYGEGGFLTERVRRAPYSVVLFDEIEKAHPDIFNILLQILDDGMLTDSRGRKADFKNTVIIMTSNIGGEGSISNPMGFSPSADGAKKAQRSRQELKKVFSPELLNRIDEVIVFDRLEREDIEKICRLLLDDVAERVRLRGIELEFSDEIYKYIADEGYDREFGARNLKRCVVRRIEDSFAEELLSGRIKPGDKVIAQVENDLVVYRRAGEN